MTNNLWNDVRLLEMLAGLGAEENRAGCPIDTMWPSESIGTEQQGRADLRVREPVSARRGVLGDLAVPASSRPVCRNRLALTVSIGLHRKPIITRLSR